MMRTAMEEGASYWLTRLLLQRGLGCIYLIAFIVALHQFKPLLGENGLLPVPLFVKRVPFWNAPSLFHAFPTDTAFTLAATFGIGLALLAVTGISERFGTPVSATTWFLLWLLYLSFVNVGQTFTAFGWESILLETGFLAIFLGAAGTEPSAITIWLMRWVLFRVMFGAGLIKLRGDPCWWDLTCMDYHYETQPMPGPLSSTFHHLPSWFHKGEVIGNHVVELLIPFLFFAPQPIAAFAGGITILFQLWLIASGNLSWLNWLTIVLAFSTFTDTQLSAVFPYEPGTLSPRFPFHQNAIMGLAMLIAVLSIQPVINMFSSRQLMNASFNNLHLVNTYGAFGSITKERYEVIVEGSSDGTVWREYEFKGKPGDIGRMPPQWAPYHLRLDWLMWFLPFNLISTDPPIVRGHPTWFIHFLQKLLQGDMGTLSLLRSNPFPDAPPATIRALLYRYQFTTPEEKRQTEAWWKREEVGTFFPPVSLKDVEH